MEKKMAIMIGIQGSGKSEFARRNLSEYVRINLDTLHTRNKEQLLIQDCIENGKSFVIDNTNSTVADRVKYISTAKENGYKIIGYFMQSILKDCIERNNLREGSARIPAKAIAATSNRLEMPSIAEGFDELYFVRNDGREFRIEEWRDQDDL